MSLGHSFLFTVLLYGNFSSLYFLLGPVLFFYLRSLRSGKTQLNRLDFVHFLPFIIVFIDTLPYYFSPYEYKVSVVRQVFSNWTAMFSIQLGYFFSTSALYILRPLLLLFYTLWGLIYLKRNSLYFFKATALGKWLCAFSLLQLLIFVGMSSVFLGVWLENTFGYTFLNHPSEIKYISLVAYMVMVCALYFFPQAIYLNVDLLKRSFKPQDVYWWKLDQLVNSCYIFNKPFLNPTLHLDQFGELVQVDRKELRDFFELYLFTNFTDEMNRLRIQFAKNLIQEGCIQSKCLDTLHIESGFINKHDLLKYFVEFEGESMEDYILKFKND
jgi:hypothetical protein